MDPETFGPLLREYLVQARSVVVTENALDWLEARVTELETQRAAALAIHQRCDDDPGGPPYCRACVQGGDDLAAPYPCPTARALGVTADGPVA